MRTEWYVFWLDNANTSSRTNCRRATWSPVTYYDCERLRIYFKRTASIFTSAEVTAGTKVPGFDSTHHIILSWMAARPYCMKYHPDRVRELNALIGDTTPEPSGMKKDIIKQFTKRSKDERAIMTMKGINYI